MRNVQYKMLRVRVACDVTRINVAYVIGLCITSFFYLLPFQPCDIVDEAPSACQHIAVLSGELGYNTQPVTTNFYNNIAIKVLRLLQNEAHSGAHQQLPFLSQSAEGAGTGSPRCVFEKDRYYTLIRAALISIFSSRIPVEQVIGFRISRTWVLQA